MKVVFVWGLICCLSLQIHYETEELPGPRCDGCGQKAGSALVSVLGIPAVPSCISHLLSTQTELSGVPEPNTADSHLAVHKGEAVSDCSKGGCCQQGPRL